MKLFFIGPNLPVNADQEATNARLRACIMPIAELIAASIEADPWLFAVRHDGEGDWVGAAPDLSFGDMRGMRLTSGAKLREVLARCGDPFDPFWVMIRSLGTCRAVHYGHDGQALVCLRTEDRLPAPPSDGSIVVEECSQLLTETDWIDGYE